MNSLKQGRLAKEAFDLHKAWLLAVAVLGQDVLTQPLGKDPIPNYLLWERKRLKRQISDLQDDFSALAKFIFDDWNPSKVKSVLPWCVRVFDRWIHSGDLIHEVGTFQEVESEVGKLRIRKVMECPPYAQMLLQGFNGAALRHPEYHLGQDLALLYNLFLDAQELGREQMGKIAHGGEHSQSLARAVILTCFNLLESFISGLATGFVMENPHLSEEILKQLREPDRKRSSLKARFQDVPAIICGKTETMAPASSILNRLFGVCKWRRDSFVHCTPGEIPDKWGTVKQEHFHDADAVSVEETVELTEQLIRLTWKIVYQREGPRWLQKREQNHRFERVDFKLQMI